MILLDTIWQQAIPCVIPCICSLFKFFVSIMLTLICCAWNESTFNQYTCRLGFLLGSVKERDYLEALGVDERITFRRQIWKPVVSCDGLSFSGLVWTFKLLPSTQTETRMAWYTIFWYILETSMWYHRMIKDNIKLDLEGVVLKGSPWICVAQDRTSARLLWTGQWKLNIIHVLCSKMILQCYSYNCTTVVWINTVKLSSCTEYG
jgi:hypothetical protein